VGKHSNETTFAFYSLLVLRISAGRVATRLAIKKHSRSPEPDSSYETLSAKERHRAMVCLLLLR
jgi:hypothetical protein